MTTGQGVHPEFLEECRVALEQVPGAIYHGRVQPRGHSRWWSDDLFRSPPVHNSVLVVLVPQ